MNGNELLLVGIQRKDRALAECVFQYRSTDGGKTWSGRKQLDMLGREPYLSKISDGTLFVSTHVLPNAPGNDSGYTFCYLYRSTDGGRTWQGTKIAYGEVLRKVRKDSKFLEKAPTATGRNVLELKDGTLVFSVGSQYGSETLWRSPDKGKTWDKT